MKKLFIALALVSSVAIAQDPGSQPIQNNRAEPAPTESYRPIIVDRVLFSRGSATIAKEDYAGLDDIANILNSRPDIILFEIQGHVDPSTEGLYADKLSLKRANAVKKYLVSKGVDPERLVAVGYGGRLPLTTGKSAQERAKNRRIELQITKKSE